MVRALRIHTAARMVRTLLWVALLASPRALSAQGTEGQAARVDLWRRDLAHLAAELPRRHPGFFTQLEPADFAAAVAELDAGIPRLPDHEIAVALAQLAALAGDAHTTVALPADFPVAPFHFQWFDDGIRAYVTGPFWGAFVGARLLAVGGVPVEGAMARIRTVVAHENEPWFRHMGVRTLRSSRVLHALGLSTHPDSVRYTLEERGGQAVDVVVEALPPTTDVTWMIAGPPEGPRRPLYRRHGELPYWYAVLPEERALYFQYNICRDDPARPMAAFAEEMFAAADSAGVERMVIDLRLNPGGNSAVLNPVLERLRDHPLAQAGRLKVLIGRRTMSSAVLNAVALRRLFAPEFLGEPSGGAPNHFGEVKSFPLPGSGLTVFHSTRFFRQAPEITTPFLAPDVTVPITWADFEAGRDPVLERALRGG